MNDSLFPVKINTFFELNLWVIDGFDGNQLMLQKLELNVKFRRLRFIRLLSLGFTQDTNNISDS